MDLDPTAPLRSDEDIRKCWELIQRPGTDVVFTVTTPDRNPYFNMVELDASGYAHLSKVAPGPVVRRQDAPRVFSMNAAAYAYRRNNLMVDDRVIGDRSRVVEMDRSRSRDVDDDVDFAFIEFLVATERASLPRVTR